jgi:hypothetical protein
MNGSKRLTGDFPEMHASSPPIRVLRSPVRHLV